MCHIMVRVFIVSVNVLFLSNSQHDSDEAGQENKCLS